MMILIMLMILFMMIDIPVLFYLYKNMYIGMFSRLNRDETVGKMRMYLSGLVVYFLLAFGLYVFILREEDNYITKIYRAFLLGVIVYGTYDFTNLATLSQWELKSAIVDVTWGGILFATVTAIYTLFL